MTNQGKHDANPPHFTGKYPRGVETVKTYLSNGGQSHRKFKPQKAYPCNPKSSDIPRQVKNTTNKSIWKKQQTH